MDKNVEFCIPKKISEEVPVLLRSKVIKRGTEAFSVLIESDPKANCIAGIESKFFVDAKYIFIYLYIFFIALEEAVVPRSSAIANKELDVSTPAVPSTALCSALTPSPAVPPTALCSVLISSSTVPSTDLCLTTPNIPQKFIHEHQFTLEKLYEMAEYKKFPDKEFFMVRTNTVRLYTSVLHFFNQKIVYNDDAELLDQTSAICRLCGQCLTIKAFPKFSNLYKHLKLPKREHDDFQKWYVIFTSRKGKPITKMDQRLFILVQYICSSNSALSTLQNPFLLKMLFPYLGLLIF